LGVYVKCNQTKQTTPVFDDDRIIVTHPFHPKTNKVYKLIGVNKSAGKEKFLCEDGEGSEFLIPVGYTSTVHKLEYDEQTIISCDFRYDDLIELLEIIKSIGVK